MSTTQIADAITTASSIPSNTSDKATTSNISVDSETFLTLLVAQLQYQDPLEPQTDTEFVTQLAQMSSLEEMQAIGTGIDSMQAYSLVGQYAYAEVTDSDTGKTNSYFGYIDSIVNDGGTYYAIVGEDAIAVDDIEQVFDPDILDTDTALVESSNLIGKIVTGAYEDDDGTVISVTGVVTGVAYKDGAIYAVVDGTPIAVDAITDISEQTIDEEAPVEQTAS